MGSCLKRTLTKKFKFTIHEIMHDIDLGETDKQIIMHRYVDEVVKSECVSSFICIFYYVLRFSISIGGVLITSLLLLEKVSFIDSTAALAIFWVCWALSLIISMANECIYAFAIDKKFFVNTLILEKLKSEGWQFMELAGKYRKYKTHREAFKHFVTRIEKLKIANVIHNLESSEHHGEENERSSDLNVSRINLEDGLAVRQGPTGSDTPKTV